MKTPKKKLAQDAIMSIDRSNFKIDCNIPYTNRVTIAICIDDAQNTEHVIIGNYQSVDHAIRLGVPPDSQQLLYDKTRKLGTLLSEIIEPNVSSEATLLPGLVCADFRTLLPYHPDNVKAAQLLENMYLSNNAVHKFISLRCWQYVLDNAQTGFSSGNLDTTEDITLPIRYNLQSSFENMSLSMSKYYSDRSADLTGSMFHYLFPKFFDNPAMLFFSRNSDRWIASDLTVSPLMTYCLAEIEKRHFVFNHCCRCGKMYIAANNHKGFCSEACRNANKAETIAKHRERSKDDDRDKIYNANRMVIYNRIKWAKDHNTLPSETIKYLEQRFSEFRKNAIALKKKAVVPNSDDYRAFTEYVIKAVTDFITEYEDFRQSVTDR